MIIDAFTIKDELDILEYRLKELSPLVDYFVLVEEPPFEFQNNKARFRQYLNKIIHVRITKPKDIPNYAKHCILSGLYHLRVMPADVISISDVNQVPIARKFVASIGFITDFLVLETKEKDFKTDAINANKSKGIIMVKGLKSTENPKSPLVGFDGDGTNAIDSILHLRDNVDENHLIQDAGWKLI